LERALLEQGLDPDLLKGADFDNPKLKEASLSPQLLTRSVQKLEQAVRWDSNNKKAYDNLFNTLFLQGNYVEAAQVLARLARQEPDSQAAVASFASLYLAVDEDQQQKMLDLWQGIPAAVSALLREGDERSWNDQDDEALVLYQDALRIDPRSARAYYRIGRVYQSRGMLGEALGAYEQAIDLDTFGQDFSNELVDTHFRTGQILSQRREWDRAKEEFQRALALDPEHSASLVGLGAVQFHQEEFDEARRSIERALAFEPDDAWARYWLGSLDYQEGLWEEAIVEFQHAIRLMPKNAWSYYWLGEAYRQAQQEDEAIVQYRKALELDPQNSVIEQRLQETEP